MIQALNLELSKDPNLKEFFKVTVETTRKTLKCDRVIVYSASNLPQGLVIAESVDAQKYDSIVGTTIKDPFLTGEHLEMYCYGLPVAIDDIYKADIVNSDLEDLEKLGIKSLAIAPILVKNNLLAFLVAHQYSKLQPWHSQAVDFLTERANTVSLALSNLAKAENLESFNLIEQTTESKEPSSPRTSQAFEEDGRGSGMEGLSLSSHGRACKPRSEYDSDIAPSARVLRQNIGNSFTMEREKNGNVNIRSTEQKTEIQEDRSKSFSDVVDRITNEQGRENILNTAVEAVRHLLECDRVVVYSLNPDNYGVVVAESVAAKWTRALGRIIDDPCFAVRYIEKYLQGRVRAWDNVYCEDATPCYLEQLEALEVKAKIVTPIVRENELFGLLIAHQCSSTRNWQEQEIIWTTEIASQIGIMLEYTKMFAETDSEEQKLLAASENLWNQHFTDAIQYIRQSITKEDILKASVKEVRRILECDRVVIYSMNSDNRGTIVAESVAAGWTKAQGIVIDDPCFEAKYLDMYRNGRVRAWSNIYESGLTRCYIEQLEELDVKANLVTPVINEGKLFGLLVAHLSSRRRLPL